jgi:hypothetical protein
VGRFKYHDLKEIEAAAPGIFANTDLTEEGKKKVLKVLKQGAGSVSFEQEDDEYIRKIIKEFQDRADLPRDHVNI